MSRDWLTRRGRIHWYDQYAMNEQETAFSRYDPDRIAAELLEIGAEIVAVYATNQYGIAYYPSSIVPQHPNLNGRDYFGDVTERLRSRGRKVIAYTNWLNSTHPEWNVIPLGGATPDYSGIPSVDWACSSNADHMPLNLPGGGWLTPCLNSPRRVQVLNLAREIIERYRPDGFHLDMFMSNAVCVCPYCIPVLRSICDSDEITDAVVAENWKEYTAWRMETSSTMIADLHAILREYDVAAFHNAFAPFLLPPVYGLGEKWLPCLDVFVSECFDVFGTPHSDLNTTSIAVKWQHAVKKPSLMLLTSHPMHYAHWPVSDAAWRVYASACKANGCSIFGPCGIGARPDTTSSANMMDKIRTGLDFFMEDADLSEGAESIAGVGLVFSWATRSNASREDELHWCRSFVGWARLLMEDHVPFDIVIAEDLTADQSAAYDLLVLPECSSLSAGTCDVLREYVFAGGHVLATGETSLYTENGDRRADFLLADVFGVKWLEQGSGNFAIERPTEAEPFSGGWQRVAASAGALARRVRVDPAGSVGGCGDPLPLETTDEPVIVLSPHGRGECLYAAFDIGGYYELRGDWHVARLMSELLGISMSEKRIEVDAPSTVEVTLWRQPDRNRMVIHLANRTVPWSLPTTSRQFTEVIPVSDIRLSVKLSPQVERVTSRHCDVQSETEDGRLMLSIPRVSEYAAIILE